jgi:ABC-type phosphate/phosphonate transport system ATPase subunit
MNKQMNLSFLRDEPVQVQTKKKEFLAQIGRSGSGHQALLPELDRIHS